MFDAARLASASYLAPLQLQSCSCLGMSGFVCGRTSGCNANWLSSVPPVGVASSKKLFACFTSRTLRASSLWTRRTRHLTMLFLHVFRADCLDSWISFAGSPLRHRGRRGWFIRLYGQAPRLPLGRLVLWIPPAHHPLSRAIPFLIDYVNTGTSVNDTALCNLQDPRDTSHGRMSLAACLGSPQRHCGHVREAARPEGPKHRVSSRSFLSSRSQWTRSTASPLTASFSLGDLERREDKGDLSTNLFFSKIITWIWN